VKTLFTKSTCPLYGVDLEEVFDRHKECGS
jgi:hypothetical protein